MAHFGLWVAALGMVCLIAVVTADNGVTDQPPIPDEDICSQFMNDGTTMTISRVFDMIAIKFIQYTPNFGTEMMRQYMQYADSDHDDRLNHAECKHLIAHIKNSAPNN